MDRADQIPGKNSKLGKREIATVRYFGMGERNVLSAWTTLIGSNGALHERGGPEEYLGIFGSHVESIQALGKERPRFLPFGPQQGCQK